MKPEIIRSARKTTAIEIRDGRLLVRAPYAASDREIAEFLKAHGDWIARHLKKAEERAEAVNALPKLSMEEIRALADQALTVIPERVRHFAPLVGVTYGRITIRNQRSRWGSCSAAGNLNFNCLLMLTPPEVLDSVVVHELCHRKEMNHSENFYREVLRVCPDYYERDRWLREHGQEIMGRMI